MRIGDDRNALVIPGEAVVKVERVAEACGALSGEVADREGQESVTPGVTGSGTRFGSSLWTERFLVPTAVFDCPTLSS